MVSSKGKQILPPVSRLISTKTCVNGHLYASPVTARRHRLRVLPSVRVTHCPNYTTINAITQEAKKVKDY